MQAQDFLSEWNKNHTSSPSFQDAIDWAEKQIIKKENKRIWTILSDDIYTFPDEKFPVTTNNINKEGLIAYAKTKMQYFVKRKDYESLLDNLTPDQIVKYLTQRFGANVIETTNFHEDAECIWFDPEMETDDKYFIASCEDKKDITEDSIILLSNGRNETEARPDEIFIFH